MFLINNYYSYFILSNEVKILILGAVIGSLLTLVSSQFEKTLDKRDSKRKAIMCLKIELTRIDKYLESLSNSERTLGSNLLPDIDIPELDLSSQRDLFMQYDYKIAKNIYELVNCLSNANKRRQIANSYLREQKNPSFSINADLFKQEVSNARKILKEIKSSINF